LAVASAGVVVAVAAAAKKSEGEILVRKYVDVWNDGDLELADEILAADVVRHGPRAAFSAQGLENLKAVIAGTRLEYPNIKVSISDIEDDGDRVALRWSVKATYRGAEYPEANGRKMKTTGTSIYRVAEGRIVEESASWDYLGVNEQLGIPSSPETPEQNQAIVRRFMNELYEKGNMDVAYEIVAEDHIFHVPAGADYKSGRDGVRNRAAMFREAFPDLDFVYGETFAAGDLVASSWTFTGTHKGEFLGVASTGKRIAIEGLSMSRVRDGKIVESWGYWDTGQLYKQLGTRPN
jgi:steroid delta-isomerase-like uncharacterized protein